MSLRWVSALLRHPNPEITLRTDEPVDPNDSADREFPGSAVTVAPNRGASHLSTRHVFFTRKRVISIRIAL